MSKYVAPNSHRSRPNDGSRRSIDQHRSESSYERHSHYKYDVVLHNVRSRISGEGGSGFTFGLERLRGFHTLDEAIQYAQKCQSRLKDDETIYVKAADDLKSCIYYVTSKIATISGDRIPIGRGK